MKLRLLYILLFLPLVAFSESAYDFSAPNADNVTVYYKITSSADRTVAVCNDGGDHGKSAAGNGTYSGVVVIPETVKNEREGENSEPYTVTSIADYAFRECQELTSVTISKHISTIGKWAFANCVSLETVNFRAANCAMEGKYVFPPFSNCPSIAELNFEEGVETIPSFLLYNSLNAAQRDGRINVVTIPASVKTIGSFVFTNDYTISIDELRYGSVNAELNEVTLPQTNTNKDKYPPFYSTQPAKLIIEEGVENIPDNMFFNCTYSKLVLPSTLKSIGNKTFNSPVTQTIECYALTPPVCPSGGISLGDKSRVKVHIPRGTADLYKAADGWKNYTNIEDDLPGLLSLTIENPINGKVTGSETGYMTIGALVTLTAAPNIGYYFNGWSVVTDGTTQNVGDAVLDLAINSDVVVSVLFSPNFIAEQPSLESPKVTLYAEDGNANYQWFTHVDEGDDVPIEGEVSSYLSLAAATQGTYVYCTVSFGNKVLLESEKFRIPYPSYKLSVTQPAHGIIEVAQNGHSFEMGTTLTLEAKPAQCYYFDKWEGSVSLAGNPASFVINEDVTVTAVFALNYIAGQPTFETPSVTLFLEDAQAHYQWYAQPDDANAVALENATGATLETGVAKKGSNVFCEVTLANGEKLKSETIQVSEVYGTAICAPETLVDEIVATEIYDLVGRRVESLQPGVNIIRTVYKSGRVENVKQRHK